MAAWKNQPNTCQPVKPFDYAAFKHVLVDSTGRKLTTGLFEELADPGSAAKPVFKLSDWRATYVAVADPTDYRAAMVLIGNWEHWQALLTSKPFVEHLEQWRREVEVLLRSEAIVELVKQSKGSKGTMAAKWLAEAGFVKRDKRDKKNREDDESTEREAKSKVAEDAKRLGLKVVR